MVSLGFPNPIKPTNSNNQTTFSELQTQDYDLTQIQSNISTYTRSVTNLLSAKDRYIILAQNPNPIAVATSTAQTPFILTQTTQDLYETYDLSLGAFTAPQDAVYSIGVTVVASLVAGAATALFFDIISSDGGTTITLATPLILSNFYLNIFLPTFLLTGTTLKFFLRTDAAATLNLATSTRLFVSWK